MSRLCSEPRPSGRADGRGVEHHRPRESAGRSRAARRGPPSPRANGPPAPSTGPGERRRPAPARPRPPRGRCGAGGSHRASRHGGASRPAPLPRSGASVTHLLPKERQLRAPSEQPVEERHPAFRCARRRRSTGRCGPGWPWLPPELARGGGPAKVMSRVDDCRVRGGVAPLSTLQAPLDSPRGRGGGGRLELLHPEGGQGRGRGRAQEGERAVRRASRPR